ncbi:leucyl aminopeptidase [Prosthecodimorpha staleyi]|uniref:Probable cytosol aminopeptidase n=1 Tax=Prosthecodimorpha staleyi TaxID=2840188 RepID=A0A947D8Q4_9HYPH|nr:leucyl aminopeptidase [Prosthecodimorpha staleyi]MBT9290092.1 leucyl aminopeptidase [Prosthecodimorpha staleyi]
MSAATIAFQKPVLPETGIVVLLAGDGAALGPVAGELDTATGGTLARAIAAAAYKGKQFAMLDLIAPAGSGLDRVLVVGLGKPAEMKEYDWTRLGGAIAGKLGEIKAEAATLVVERPDGVAIEAAQAADIALGASLRHYRFDRYKTKKKDDEANGSKGLKLSLAVEGHAAAKKAWAGRQAVADGVTIARDLVIEPPNVLSPEEFARRAKELQKLGVEVEILTEKEMKKLGMGAFLGVGQGSSRPPRLVVMRWSGGKEKDQPIAFIGKGVVFDTGGISIKPAAGMEDMKGDMAGAACVTGLMHALAARKAKANVIGAIGLVENMPDGNAQRPGDIVTSMSGQTIEIINTDAEGRLVLADVVWYVQDRFKPRFMLDLATLTGAILVALGKTHAGLFSTSDELAAQVSAAGEATGERVWRMPLGPDYDKMIDSTFADMKNTGGRYGGSITAAQFIKRFTNDVPWVHLDIAGTGMEASASEINKAWSSGWGVRLLDRMVKDNYEG